MTARFEVVVVATAGFEPAKAKADGFTVRPIWPLWYIAAKSKVKERGASDPNRTDNLRFTKPLLYR